jgi:type II secretory pathway pseudopilin PulG
MAIICATGLIALALVLYGLHNADANGKSVVFVVVGLSIGAGMIALSRSLTARKRAQLELSGGEQYRALAEEYRRLADLAVTAQEHTDLKLGAVSAQLDYLREQTESLQKILKEVE